VFGDPATVPGSAAPWEGNARLLARLVKHQLQGQVTRWGRQGIAKFISQNSEPANLTAVAKRVFFSGGARASGRGKGFVHASYVAK
jgi:hypothetical protein